MYGYKYDLITDGSNCYIGAYGHRAIDLQRQKLVTLPVSHTILLPKDRVKELCKTLVKEHDTPRLKDIKIGDYVQFSACGSFNGFVVYKNNGDFDTTGDKWNTVFPFLKNTKGHILLAHVPAKKVLECLLNNI